MPQTYTAIIAKLKTVLEGILQAPAKPLFGEVHDYAEGNFETYPAAVIFERTGDGVEIDTHRNERNWTFRIILYQEQSSVGKTKSEAAANMRLCVDKVLQTFDENRNLDGLVARVKVVPVALDFSPRTGKFTFATIDITLVDLVNNYPTP